uniref:Uncharacterized protein n=1 Tax=Siphoviridae sp. ctkyp1 TaxID=2825646 RepID=A0A8S5P5J1_9CAUD|nr:MAG TPA: hypothetical protein [Siphoviridae sp. ctkyp1]DAH50136.1 MAG TPA: hypothetical protein [Caudoviricetes sp.]DAI82201.1 MAG TPA: hypothetical protein [Bacteriophage sp.]DAL19311.1 MAG TPA_asm: hypothetical protein [Caudoviricetes sp.]DAL61630.1 MAG TPA_asm: hypothetical protein [Caudoviricetes sp.]
MVLESIIAINIVKSAPVTLQWVGKNYIIFH